VLANAVLGYTPNLLPLDHNQKLICNTSCITALINGENTMPAISNTNRIKKFYTNDADGKLNQDQTVGVSFRVPLDVANMLTVIAERFCSSRHALGVEILSDACDEMFQALTPEDREELGRKADDLTTQQMLEKGYSSERIGCVPGTDRFGKWEVMACVYNDTSYEESSE